MRMPTISRGRALAYLAAIGVALVLGGRFFIASDTSAPANGETAPASELRIEEPTEIAAAKPDLVLVHVAGAVRRPGLYSLPAGSRVDDAIRAAGGPKSPAALTLVNLAAPVADGQQVVVPRSGRAGAPVSGSSPGGTAGPAPRISLNSATIEELDTLPGVGPVTAQRIVDYREQHGPFSTIEDLDAVPGIGPARLEQLRELLIL